MESTEGTTTELSEILGDSPDDMEFFDAMSGEKDPMVFVIRGAAYLEREVYRFIHGRVEVPKAVDNLKLEFHTAVGLAVALGLRSDVAVALRAVASIRNKFAHSASLNLTGAMMKDLWKTLSPDLKSGFQSAWVRVFPERAPLPRALGPADAFCFVVVCLRALVKSERSGHSRSAGGSGQ